MILITFFQLHHEQISSMASEELQSFRNAELSLQKAADPQEERLCIPPAPAQPPPPPPTQLAAAAPKFSATSTGNPGEARQALMEAIRSGAGAAKLKKVSVLLYFIVDETTYACWALRAIYKLLQPHISFFHQKKVHALFSLSESKIRNVFQTFEQLSKHIIKTKTHLYVVYE